MLDPYITVNIAVEAYKKLRQLENEVPNSWGRKLRCQDTFQALQWAYLSTMSR